ncbi:MAG: amidohydrolase family protein [Streptosporangiaceae bacterium]
MADEFDLVVRHGKVVTAASEGVADVGLRAGRVAALGESLGPGRSEIDATGLLVIPGGIDAHVHLTPVTTTQRSLAWVDDFASGSRAAAAGGITTVGNITFPAIGETLLQAHKRVMREAEAASVTDFFLHPVLLEPGPGRLAEIDELAAAGVSSLKFFMHLFGFDAAAADYLRALDRAGRAGLMSLVHCEDAAIITVMTEQLVARGRTGLENFPASRPVSAESAAVARAVAFAEAAGAPVYLVHLSSERAIAEVRAAQSRGVLVYAETRPIYLLFTRERFDGPDAPLYVGNPPLREGTDVAALWHGLAAGTVATCCTDHAPWTRAQKLDPALDVAHTRPGMAELETMLPSLYSEGVRAGRLSLSRFVEVTSTNAARLFGLYPRKGTVAVGSDADLVLWDPEATRTVRGDELHTRAAMSLLEGRKLTGWPRTTISRGEVICHDGQITATAARGRLASGPR